MTQKLQQQPAIFVKAAVRRIAVTATYTDATGAHEMDIDDIEVTPFMVTRSGEHRIHIMLSE